MGLSDYLKQSFTSESERVAAAITRLSSDREAAQARLNEAETAWSRALADEAEGLPPAESSPTVEELETRMNVARNDVNRTSTALDVARARQQLIQAKEERAALAEKWDRVEELCATRDRDVAKLAKSCTVLVSDYLQVTDDTVSIFHALNSIFGAGKIPDSDGALVFTGQGDSIKGLVQRELWRRGLEWNFKLGMVERATTEPIEERFKDASRLIRQWRSRKQV